MSHVRASVASARWRRAGSWTSEATALRMRSTDLRKTNVSSPLPVMAMMKAESATQIIDRSSLDRVEPREFFRGRERADRHFQAHVAFERAELGLAQRLGRREGRRLGPQAARPELGLRAR